MFNVRMSAQNIFAFLCKYSDRGGGQYGSEEDFMESNICPPLTPRTPQGNQKDKSKTKKKHKKGQTRIICPPLIYHN